MHRDVFLLCGDLGYSVLEPFAERYPDRYLNVGVAEQNMTGVAVGLAREGFNVFTYSIGNFPTLRCMEQIRYDVCYHGANVKVVAVGAGYAYGPQGTSHHTTEDIAMLRAIPNMTVCSPADPVEALAAARFMVAHKGPGYVRLNRSGEPMLHNPDEAIDFRPGHMINIRAGAGTAVFAVGAIVELAVRDVADAHLGWAVYSSPFIGGYDRDELLQLAARYDRIVTIEEHQLNGGFGSSIVEAFSDLYAEGALERLPPIKRIGIPNKFISHAGTQEFLRASAGIGLRT